MNLKFRERNHGNLKSPRKYLLMNESDLRSDVHYLGSSENKA